MHQRRFSSIDNLVIGLDKAVRTVFATPIAGRPCPADEAVDAPDEPTLAPGDARVSGALMRVNHAGEVCAQALYQGQGLTARSERVRRAMRQASDEENDHLAWCQARLDELGEHKSRLSPVWFLGSFTLGGLAGAFGDRWSLGFLAETERQVVRHLDGHLQRLPADDQRSRRIVQQMKTDEGRHASQAMSAGGRDLPTVVKKAMHAASRVMTTLAARF
ncbi:MAG: 2-polyprenyl-3-methyl-6-methoxy-1,4-benzoquinone monooxygenase [Gammaproteobacteria bacterium]|nr:2-polyprenyl-3-methyl-6-methoxy-1,4-benzoquinone monooxygenase [Gammaproteobacteria bacterium]